MPIGAFDRGTITDLQGSHRGRNGLGLGAAGRTIDRVAPRRSIARKARRVTCSEARVGPDVVGRDVLGAGGECGVAAFGVAGAGFAGVGVSPGADEEALGDAFADEGFVFVRFVHDQYGGFGRLKGRACADKGDAVFQGGVAIDIGGPAGGRVVDHEDHLAPRLAECRPAPREDAFAQRGMGAAHLIRRNDAIARKDGQDLRFDTVEPILAECAHGRRAFPRYGRVLRVDHDQDRGVRTVCIGPGFHLAEAIHESRAAGSEVDIGGVDDLDAGLCECGAVGRRDGDALLREETGAQRIGESAAFGIVDRIDLDLSRAGIELFGDGAMPVVEREGGVGVALLDELHQGRVDLELVGVVGADGLYLVEAEGIVQTVYWRRRHAGAGGECEASKENKTALHCRLHFHAYAASAGDVTIG